MITTIKQLYIAHHNPAHGLSFNFLWVAVHSIQIIATPSVA